LSSRAENVAHAAVSNAPGAADAPRFARARDSASGLSIAQASSPAASASARLSRARYAARSRSLMSQRETDRPTGLRVFELLLSSTQRSARARGRHHDRPWRNAWTACLAWTALKPA
jgi:hypothetical protein